VIDNELFQNAVLERLTELEEDINHIIQEMPCSHRYPHDEEWTYDDEREGEVMILICRNCGDRV
jgi:hypothetical protein